MFLRTELALLGQLSKQCLGARAHARSRRGSSARAPFRHRGDDVLAAADERGQRVLRHVGHIGVDPEHGVLGVECVRDQRVAQAREHAAALALDLVCGGRARAARVLCFWGGGLKQGGRHTQPPPGSPNAWDTSMRFGRTRSALMPAPLLSQPACAPPPYGEALRRSRLWRSAWLLVASMYLLTTVAPAKPCSSAKRATAPLACAKNVSLDTSSPRVTRHAG